ncbi:putative ankyrin repeat protein [Acanthamoeba polyphaga mimivirus]|uniref:Putative ankyrin repeat protein n=1 Tax=Acanthamoeba polyphaga mimivirus TaxID=212035 RepID=A0A0G2Y118_MIMIV|nr:putative ankyrin repeat protein [Acanthamoeba polyphaga mimivirus]QTF49525.1 putative ankyrin repeat protein [Mimivirus reunion]WMV61968.1 putative ankyrin repeat protein [Mimivirus sp.]WMV62945.1 putative ankyrin repeat protein [Acanthamoeba polyphaga mimivirus]WMV63922.1 putative ankyrin repeat protein [Mimivirus sp.]
MDQYDTTKMIQEIDEFSSKVIAFNSNVYTKITPEAEKSFKKKSVIDIDCLTTEKQIELMKLSIKHKHPKYSFIELSNKFSVDLSCDDNIFLKLAVNYNNEEVLKYLIDSGIDVTIENNFAVKLQSGIMHNNRIIDLLINNGADITVDNYFPYRYAASEQNKEALKILFSYNPNVDATMLLASINPSEIGAPILDFLISLNADININNGAILRENNQYYPVVKSLLKAGADISYLSTKHLVKIIRSHNKRIIDIYIKFGVDFSKINDIAIEEKDQEYVDTLINWGIEPRVLACLFSSKLSKYRK